MTNYIKYKKCLPFLIIRTIFSVITKQRIDKMDQSNLSQDQKKINSITIWGMVINIILSAIKILAGSIVKSVALIADGIHSLSDLVTDVAVLVSSKAARRPADTSHPYGHGKIETIGTLFIGLILLIVGGGIGWSAVHSLYHGEKFFPGPIVAIIAFVSVVAKELLFQFTQKLAKQIHSSSLYANAWHHRSDALSSVAVLIGGGLSLFGLGYGDQLAGLVVGIMIIAVAGKILFDGIKELSEHAIDRESIKIIEQTLNNHQEVNLWHKLRTRKIGAELFVDVHIHVDPDLSVFTSHKLTKEIEESIQDQLPLPVNILIHVEPCLQQNSDE
jgi:cation diffusion facilitator family transporter